MRPNLFYFLLSLSKSASWCSSSWFYLCSRTCALWQYLVRLQTLVDFIARERSQSSFEISDYMSFFRCISEPWSDVSDFFSVEAGLSTLLTAGMMPSHLVPRPRLRHRYSSLQHVNWFPVRCYRGRNLPGAWALGTIVLTIMSLALTCPFRGPGKSLSNCFWILLLRRGQ